MKFLYHYQFFLIDHWEEDHFQTFGSVQCLPLYKKGDKSALSNYRPVSFLGGVGKLLERIVFKNIYNFLHENNLLYRLQSGFLPNHSTTFQP